MNNVVVGVAGVASVGCAIAAGVFFAFSSFVMPGLARLTAPQSVQAMQQINTTAVTPPFMLVLFGAAAVAASATIAALVSGSTGSAWILAGTIIYVVGVLGVTIAVHVPLNDALADNAAGNPSAISAQWASYAQTWIPWNHVRALAGAVSAGALVIGAVRAAA